MTDSTTTIKRKRQKTAPAHGDDEKDPNLSIANSDESKGTEDSAKRRRAFHNLSEQRRARRIRDEIDRLRDELEMAGKPFKHDRHSILQATVEYIAELKEKANTGTSDALTTTISHAMSPASPTRELMLPASQGHAMYNIGLGPLNVDYGAVFTWGSVAQAVASLEGKFLDANKMFCTMSGYTREELMKRSFFNLTPEGEIPQMYAVVSDLLQKCANNAGQNCNNACTKSFRKLCVMRHGLTTVFVSMSLIKDNTGKPKCFACSALPMVADSSSCDTSSKRLLEQTSKALCYSNGQSCILPTDITNVHQFSSAMPSAPTRPMSINASLSTSGSLTNGIERDSCTSHTSHDVASNHLVSAFPRNQIYPHTSEPISVEVNQRFIGNPDFESPQIAGQPKLDHRISHSNQPLPSNNANVMTPGSNGWMNLGSQHSLDNDLDDSLWQLTSDSFQPAIDLGSSEAAHFVPPNVESFSMAHDGNIQSEYSSVRKQLMPAHSMTSRPASDTSLTRSIEDDRTRSGSYGSRTTISWGQQTPPGASFPPAIHYSHTSVGPLV